MSKAKEPQFGVVEIEAFAEMCPNLDRHHLPECARQALAPHGASPRKLSVGVGAVGSEMSVRFGQPDPTVTSSYQRGEFVEKGAICLAALLTPVALDAEEVVLLSVAHKRRSLAGGQSVVLDDLVDAGGFRRSALDTHEAAFLASLDVAGLPRGDLHALYQGLHDRITALEVARVAGVSTPVITAERAAAQREVLAVWAQRKKEIAGLRAQAEREAQISRRVELNVTIQRLEAEVAASMRALQERSP